MATPDSVMFSANPVEGTQAESELVIFRSELSEYNPDSNKFVRINLPVADKGWIDWSDSVLSLKFTNRSYDDTSGSTTETKVRTSLANLIKSVSILNSQGEQIEYINNYNSINAIMDDYSMGKNHKESVEQILTGCSKDGNPANAETIAGGSGTSEADGSSLVMTDRLMTAFTSGQFLCPLGYLVGTSPAIVLELEDPDTALQIDTEANTHSKYKVSSIVIRAKQIRFNSEFNQSFEKTLAEAGASGVNYISETFIHSQNSIPASTTGAYNVPFSVNPRSAKYILCQMRTETEVTKRSGYSINLRSGGALTQYNWEIAGKMYPAQPITLSNTDYANGYSNVLDCLGQIGALNHSTLLDIGVNNTKFYDRTFTTFNKFVAGLVLEDFNSATNPRVYSGMHLTTAGQLSFRPSIDSSQTLTALRCDFFTCCDISIHITIDGRMYSVK